MAERRPLLRTTLARREEAHRRMILLGIAALLILSMSPLIGHHLPIGFDGALAGRDHLWAICIVALHIILEPVHAAFHLLFLGGVAYAVWDRVRAWRSLRTALTPLSAAPPEHGTAIWNACAAAAVDPRRVLVVSGLPTPAFTTGWWQPRIYVAAALSDTLPEAELHAVLAHEAAHLATRDPLRLSALRFLSCTLFWIPALRRLTADIAAEREVQADDHAAERHGLALASALVRLAAWNSPARTTAAVGFATGDLLERRVRRLTGDVVLPHSRVTRLSLAGAAAALLLAWSAGIAVAHPMPHGHDTHCDRQTRAAFSHLFCKSMRAHSPAEPCPYRLHSH